MIELPEQFVETMRRELGCEAGEALCLALDAAPTVSLRINTRKTTSEPYAGERIPWSRDGRYLRSVPSSRSTPRCMPEPTTCRSRRRSSSAISSPRSRCRGMRTGHVCRTGRQDDHILDTRRLRRACRRQRNKPHPLAGSCRQRKTLGTGQCLGHEQRAAPCGGIRRVVRRSGRRCPVLGRRHVPQDGRGAHGVDPRAAETCAARQREILAEAWRTLRPGGILLYSTCTFNRTEDEDVVAWAQSQWHDMLEPMSDIECPDAWGIARSRIGAFQTFRFMPHSARGEGFFAAAARKRATAARLRIVHAPSRGAGYSPLRTSAPQRSCSAGSQSPMR